jgi:hypothetical protein
MGGHLCSRLSVRAPEGQVVAKLLRFRADEILFTDKSLDVMWSAVVMDNITEPPATLVENSSLIEDQNGIFPSHNGADDIVSSCL